MTAAMINRMKNKFRKNWIMSGPAVLAGVAGIVLFSYACSASRGETSDLHVFNITTPQELKDFFRYTEDHLPIISSHRGGAKEGYPENALATFEHTLRHTWSIMEVDPRYTKDSVIVLFHDQTLDRTSTGQGNVSDYTYSELMELKLKDTEGNVTDYTIPTLAEALEWARGKTVLVLDQKDVPVEERVRMVQEHQAKTSAIVMAYSLRDAQRIYELDPDIMMQVFMPDEEAVARFDASGVPWENIIAFVTHKPLNEEFKRTFRLINEKGAMAIIGTSRTIDREYTTGAIDENELALRYQELIQSGANIIEADLGIEAGSAIEQISRAQSVKRIYFINE